RADAGALEVGEGVDDGAAGNPDASAEIDVWLDEDVGLDLSVVREEHRFGGKHGDAGEHDLAALALLPDRLGLGEFGAVVDAERVLEAGFRSYDLQPRLAADLDNVGE